MKFARPLLLPCLLALASSSLAAPYQFDEAAYREDVKTLASDAFGGRAPLSEGEQMTLDYLTSAFKAMGLKGAFDGQYLQPVPMAKITAGQDMQLKVGELSFTPGEDFTARTQRVVPRVELKGSDMLFVGYGINAPEYGWNDYAGVDVRGKTVVMLVNDPGFATQDPKVFKGNAMTYYGRWTYKYEEAARQGAEAVFIVHEDAPAAYGWGVVKNSNTNTKFTLVDDNNNQSQVGVMGWLQYAAAKQILAASGQDIEALKLAAKTPGFKAVPLSLKADLTLNNHIERAESHNVAAILPGQEAAGEAVVLHAHWDHLGQTGEAGKTVILNGAVDNASGVAGVLSLARHYAALPAAEKPGRSVIFSAFTAEETGLIGAQYFAENPPLPTGKLVSFLNIDGMNVGEGVDYILRYGEGVSELEAMLTDAAKAQGRQVKADPRPQNGLMFRSDHFALAKEGVPGLLFMSLGDTDPDYIAHKYHKGADDYSPGWQLGGVKQDLELIDSLIQRLAYGKEWPKWLEESDFKVRRAKDGR